MSATLEVEIWRRFAPWDREDDIDDGLVKLVTGPIDQLRHVKPDDAEHIGEERVNGRLWSVEELVQS